MYAEIGPQVRSATVRPPSIDDKVPYTSLIHVQSTVKDPAGMSTLKTALEHQLKSWVLSNYLHSLLANPLHPGHIVHGTTVCVYQSSIIRHHEYLVCRNEAA